MQVGKIKNEVYSVWDIQCGATCQKRLRVCVLGRFSHVRLFAIPWMVCSLLGSSLHGILQAGVLEWVAIPFSRGFSWPRDWTHVSHVSCIGRQILYHWAIKEAPLNLFPAVCTEAAGVPGVETGQQNPQQSGSARADKVVTQPGSTDSDYMNMKNHSIL